LIELELGALGRVLVRPSGTEPKLKIYVDIRGEAPGEVATLREKERELVTHGRGLATALRAALGLE
jgi:phosphomannomutase